MNISIYQVLQIIISVVLIVLVLIQAKGTGLSSAFGGAVGFYRSRRGIEKSLLILTILFGIFLAVNSLIMLFTN